MNWHMLLVFIHVTSAIALSAGALISLFGLLALRRAQRIEQVQSILGLLTLAEPVSGVALVLTPAAGLLMTINTWGWHNGWINVALGSMALLLLPAGATMGLRRRTIAILTQDLSAGPLAPTIRQRIHDPVMATAGCLMVTLVLGVVFLMTTKPALDGSLIAMGVSLALGFVASLPLWRASRNPQPMIDQS
jgi:hypothetical protein